MEKKAVIVPSVAIIVIGALTGIALKMGIDGDILYWSIVGIAGLAGYEIQRSRTRPPS